MATDERSPEEKLMDLALSNSPSFRCLMDQDDLARECSVSVHEVRVALARLETDGLVRVNSKTETFLGGETSFTLLWFELTTRGITMHG